MRLKAWWAYRMAFGPDPLGERLTLMWHNHFATSNLKVDDPSLMRRQNDLFRHHGRGPFGDLLRAVVRDPALLSWLDAPENHKGRPNENLARELMELFTLGVGHYTERDVREAARALTGWTVAEAESQFVAAAHDRGDKTILGRSGGLSDADLLAILLDHPATADRLAWRICDTFLGEDVLDDQGRKSLATGLRDHDLNIGWAIATVLRSETFFRKENLRSKILGPAELVVGAVRSLGIPADGGASVMAIGDGPLPVAVRGRKTVASGLVKIDAFQLVDTHGRPKPLMPGGTDDLAAFVRRSALEAYATADRLSTLMPEGGTDPTYPESALASRLRIIARLIRGGLGTRVYYTSQPGYDTHASQLFKQNALLGDLSGSLIAFRDDLASVGLADRVLVMAFSEFGRRVDENGGRGTDHGTAGPVFLTGPCIRPGLVGAAPSLLDLDDGDLKWSIDFRRIYATLLQDWLGLPAREALGGDFERLPLVRG